MPPLDANTGKIEQYHITEPCPATLVGLESARQGIRSMLNRIVAEVDDITKNPELAVDEKRTAPYMGPFLFKELLPVSVSVPATEFASTQPDVERSESSDAVVSNLTDMASKGGGVVRF